MRIITIINDNVAITLIPNTPGGRNGLPKARGAFSLRDRKREVVFTGMTNNIQRRVKTLHRDPGTNFAWIQFDLAGSARVKKP